MGTDEWRKDLDQGSVERQAENIKNKERGEAEAEPEREEIEKVVIEGILEKGIVLEEIVERGKTIYDRGIVKGGILVEERNPVWIGIRCMPAYIDMILRRMVGKHKNLYSTNMACMYATKAGDYKFKKDMRIKPYYKLRKILSDLCINLGYRDGYYVSLAVKKDAFNFGVSMTDKKMYSNFYWVDGEISKISDNYNITKSSVAVVYCMYGLVSSNGKLVSQEMINIINKDISTFINFVEYKYSILSNSILRILTDAVCHYEEKPKLNFIRLKNINDYDKELYIKIVEILKNAGVEVDESANQ